MNDYRYLFKIVLVGDTAVGKTSLVTQYMDKCFMETTGATIGVDFRIRTVEVGDIPVKLQIWDTAGQERFRSICNQYYRHADALILVYDVSNATSFANVSNWITQIEKAAKPNVVKFLIGNKTDDESRRVVSTMDGEQMARANQMDFLETSAKLGNSVERIFIDSATLLTRWAVQEDKVYAERSDYVYVGKKRGVKVPSEEASIFSCCSMS